MIVAFEGIDGSGKSTIAALLLERLKQEGLEVESVSNSSVDFEQSFVKSQMEKLRDIIWCPPDEESDSDVLGAPFYFFLLAAWYSVLGKYVIAPLRESSRVGIFENWYYRVIAKAMIRSNVDQTWLTSLFSGVPKPDLLVLLDIEPALAWSRRSSFKNTEVGLWDGFTGDRFTAYCQYQQLVRTKLLEFAEAEGWLVVHQDEHTTPADVLNKVAERTLLLASQS